MSDLALSGATSIDYTVTVTGTSGNTEPISGSTSFVLTVKNPCIDTSFVWITEPTMSALSYIIADDAKLFDAHPEFTINTSPIVHSLCGPIAYSATFNGVEVDSDPLSYASSTRKFTADS